MSAFATTYIDKQAFEEAENFLTRIPFEMRSKVINKALRNAAAPVVDWAKKLAPDSVKSSSRLGWSKKTRDKRAGKAQLSETVIVKSVSYRSVDAVFIGPSWPAGNIINVVGHPHAQVLWGRRTGRTIQPNQFLQHASQLTIPDQNAAFTNTFAKAFDSFLRAQAKAIRRAA